MALPDIPDTSWQEYQAQLFRQATDARIAGVASPQSADIEAVRASVAPAYRHYVDVAVAAARRYNVDPLIYVKQIRQESGFNPSAGSNEGAKGIAQFTDPTARGFGIDAWNADQSLDAGARYMRQNLNATGGDYRLALASYNAGGGNVAKYGQRIFDPSYLKSQGWSDQDANQPATYIRTILGDQAPQPPRAVVQPTMGAQQPAPAPNPNAAWNAQQQATFNQSLQSAPDTSAWSSVTVPTDATPQPSFRAHAQARMDALGGADATQYPADAGQAAGGILPTQDAGATLGGLDRPPVLGGQAGVSSLAESQPPTDNANLKGFASYATSKIASLSDPAASTTPTAPLGYNDMAGASSSPGTPAFGVNPQDQKSPIEQARAAAFSPTAAPPSPPPVATGVYMGPAPYSDMAGVNTSPTPAFGSNPQDVGSPIERARQAGTGTQLLPGPTPLTDVANATGLPQWAAANRARYGAAYTPQLGTIADQPAREQPIAAGFDRGYTPGQVTAQNELATNMALGTVGEVPEALGKFAAPLVADAGKVIRPAVESFANHAAQVLGEAPPVAAPAIKDPLTAIHEMYASPAPQAPPRSPAQVAKAAGDTFVRLMTDRGAPLANFQQGVARTLGRPLRVNEMAAELSRLNPDMAARVKIQEGLQPALQAVGQENLPALLDYLTAQHNIDVAKTLGQRVQAEALQAPLATTTAERQAQALNGRLRMYQRLRQDGAVAGDDTVVTHYDQLIADTQKELGTVNKRALRQVTAADAQRAAEAQAKGQAVTANRQFSGGINQNESRQALVQLQQVLGPARFARVEQAAQQVWRFADGIRQQAVDSGLWTPELAAELRQDYPHYVPTKILDYMQEPGAIANGTSLSVRDQGLKRLTIEGTDKVREDPLASLVRAQYEMQALAGKNRAFNAFVRLNERLSPEDRIIREMPTGYKPTVHEAALPGFIDGKKVTYLVPKEYETVIKQEANAPIKGLAPALQLYKGLLTSKNPAFIAGQVPLDAMSYIIRETTRGGGPQALPGVLHALFSAYGDAWKGFGSQTFRGDTAAFLKGGGGMGGFFRTDAKAVRANVAELARSSPLTVNNGADLARIVKDILTLKPVEAVGERFELAPRVASMKLAQQRGLNNVQAVINGRTVTMDFAQGGSLAKFINQFIPFFNVGMQGLATPARVIRDNPRGALASFLTLLAAPTIGAEAWNRADPQRAKDYADIPNYIKDRSIVLMLPVAAPTDTQGERRPQYIEIRAREFAPFVDFTRAALSKALGDNPRSWQDLAGGALNAASPISTDSALGLFGSLVPPGISTGLDLSNNRSSYTGATIATKNTDQRASALSKGLTTGINAASDATGLGLNVRPSQTEFAGRDLTGGAGQIVRDVSNIAARQPTSGLPQDTPLVGQVTRRFVGGSVGQRLQTAQGQRMSSAVTPILRDAGIYDITPVADHIGKIPLSNDEQAIYQETASQYIDQLLPAIAASPAYQSKSPADRAVILQNAMSNARQLAREYTLTQVDRTAILDRIQAEQAQKAG